MTLPLQNPSTPRLSIPLCSNDAPAAARPTRAALIKACWVRAAATKGRRHAVFWLLVLADQQQQQQPPQPQPHPPKSSASSSCRRWAAATEGRRHAVFWLLVLADHHQQQQQPQPQPHPPQILCLEFLPEVRGRALLAGGAGCSRSREGGSHFAKEVRRLCLACRRCGVHGRPLSLCGVLGSREDNSCGLAPLGSSWLRRQARPAAAGSVRRAVVDKEGVRAARHRRLCFAAALHHCVVIVTGATAAYQFCCTKPVTKDRRPSMLGSAVDNLA